MVAIFADIIKILTIFIKTIHKDSRKVRTNRNYVSKYNLYLYWYSKICSFLVKKCWCQQNSRGVSGDSYLDLVWVRYNCAKFHHCMIWVTDLGRGAFSAPHTHPWAAPKKPILNRVLKISIECWKSIHETHSIMLFHQPNKHFHKMLLYNPYEQFLINIHITYYFLVFIIHLFFVLLWTRAHFFIYKTFTISYITA